MANYGMLKDFLKSQDLSNNHRHIKDVKLAKVKMPCRRQ